MRCATSLIKAMIHYQAVWFQLTGKFLILWVIGSLVISFLRESLTQDLFKATSRYGKNIFHLARLALLYGLVGAAVTQGAGGFQVRPDVIDLLKFAISVSIVVILFLFHPFRKMLLYATILSMITLEVVGLDLRFLLIFAGAAGIGIGLGLQHTAANIISGFAIIFGGKMHCSQRQPDFEHDCKLFVVVPHDSHCPAGGGFLSCRHPAG